LSRVLHRGEAAQHGDLRRFGQRQRAVIFQQHGAFLGRFQREGAMGFAGDQLGAIGGQGVLLRGKAQLRAQDAAAGAVDHLGFDGTLVDRRDQLFAEDQRFGVFDIEPRRGAIEFVHAAHPVGMDEAFELPFIAQNIGQQHAVLPREFAIDLVVGAHHRSNARVEAMLEMRQIDFVQGALVGLHIDLEAGVLHRIQREMLHRADDIMRLDAGAHRGAHHAEVIGVLAIGFCARPQAGWRSRLMQTAPEKLQPCARASTPIASPMRSSRSASKVAPRAMVQGKQVELPRVTPRGPSVNHKGERPRRSLPLPAR
jgi:hypothetical protein